MGSVSTHSDLSRAGSYMTFSSGVAHYSLPVDCVRYITSIDTIKLRTAPDKRGGRHQVFDFEDRAVVLHRFSQLVGANSQIDECKALIELLRQRKQDHIDWIAALEHCLRTGQAFNRATDPHKCAFGVWYDQYLPRDLELKNIMAQFDQPHCRIHSLAQRLLGLAMDEGHVDDAIEILEEERFTTLKALMALFDRAEARLNDLIKPVAMIVDVGTSLYALELDNIEDIHEFDDRHWLAHGHQESVQHLCYDGFFQKGDGHLFIKLDPYKLVRVI